MEFTTHGFWTTVHGMGFGALYLLSCSFAMVELYRRYRPQSSHSISVADEKFLATWLVAMAVVAWITVLTGAYLIYPWYRAVPPGGAVLAAFPQAMLKSSPDMIGWHTIGGADFCFCIVRERWDCGILWRGVEQARSR